jgi:CRISPR-associated protein Csy3
MAKKENIASVLAFEKKLVPSDGYMYGTTWDQRNNKAEPLNLIVKSVRGTISNRLKKPLQDDPAKLDAKVENPNLQRVDNCALSTEQDTLKLYFTLKILSNVEQPSACNNAGFNATYTAAAKNYIEQEGFRELAKRYAINIANARYLWRNRVGTEKIEVKVKVLEQENKQEWIFDAKTIGLKDFNYENESTSLLAKEIARALTGEIPFLLLEITTYAKIGNAQEVYPSEELVLDKSNSENEKSKTLYKIGEIAGMHSQKIGNALRTIDTWYPDYGSVATGPIAIEPYGAVTNLGIAYRNPKNKADFYTLFDKFARGEALSSKEEEHYVMAVLVRGGVFGESEKSEE